MLIKNPHLSSDCRNIVRDRTLILRILVTPLETYIRDKITILENSVKNLPISSSSESQEFFFNEFIDLDSVLCHPASLSSKSPTLWTFECNGISYPARLVNLPCPVELYKTHDHAMYYKCVDIAQMLVVYSDISEMEKVESSQGYFNEQYPSYYPHGLTPPMYQVVERRFCNRQHNRHKGVPSLVDVRDVEQEMLSLVNILYKSGGMDVNFCKKGVTNDMLTTLGDANNKLVQEIEDELVEYEPWMDDHGRTPRGITFNEDDEICWQHPEIWLNLGELKEIESNKSSKNAYFFADKVLQEKINVKKKVRNKEIREVLGKSNINVENSMNNLNNIKLDDIVGLSSSREVVDGDGMKDNMDHVFLDDELQMEDQILKEGFGFDFDGDGDEGLGVLL